MLLTYDGEESTKKNNKKLYLSMDLYDRITGPPPSFHECVTYGKKSRNVVNDEYCDLRKYFSQNNPALADVDNDEFTSVRMTSHH